MRRCKPQANNCAPSLMGVPALQPPRGLDLIQTSAKFYSNGVVTTKLTIQASHQVLSAPSKRTTIKNICLPFAGSRVRATAIMFLLSLLLPSLGLAAIVSYGTWMANVDPSDDASSLAAPLANQATTVTSNVRVGSEAENVSTHVIIHKVKTERIDRIGSSAPNQQ